MGRLIDSDALKKDILSQSILGETMGKVLDRYIHVVDSQPTVFDVDKVVEQLKEVEKIMTSPVTEDCFGEECRASDCTVCLISKAIEIVKGGGVDGN